MTADTPARRRGARKAAPGAVEKLTAPRGKRLSKAPEQNPVTRKVAGVKPEKTKMTSWMPKEDAAQVRAAFLATRQFTDYRSLTDMINTVVLREVRRLQDEHNGGKPWPGARPGDVPTGRPL
jgi:hypothetical protein